MIKFAQFFLLGFFFFFSIQEGYSDLRPELVIYTYSSFMAPGALGAAIFPLFEKKLNCRLRVVGVSDGGQLLTVLDLDQRRKKRGAHVVIGIDQNLWARVQRWVESWDDWKPEGYSDLIPESQIQSGFLPFDYAPLTFIADYQLLEKQGLPLPQSFLELQRPEWRRRFILEDPRTSTPGLVFLLYSHSILKDKTWFFWQQLRQQWLTLSLGWEGAYSLFSRHEAPLIWSYVTSQAYHEEQGDSLGDLRRYRALPLREGHPLQIEGAFLVKGAFGLESERRLARKFLEFLISPEVQGWVPRKAWMLPVRKKTPLPSSFQNLPKILNRVALPTAPGQVEETLSRWRATVR